MAKKSHKGNFVSAPADLGYILKKEYKERPRPRPMHPKFGIAKKYRKKENGLKLNTAQKYIK